MLYTDPVTTDPPSQGTKIYRPPTPGPDFEVSGFHWASLTSGSRATALWILLAPYALANAAGWMSGWRLNPTRPTEESVNESWVVKVGRAAVRAASMALTVLFVSQVFTAAVVLPMAWLDTNETLSILWWEISLGGLDSRIPLLVLVMVVVALFFWLVTVVSTKTHYEENTISRIALLLDPSGGAMKRKVGDIASKKPEADPAGAPITDPRLWAIHPMLHRLRRLHFGLGMSVISLSLFIWVGSSGTPFALLVLFGLIAGFSIGTTYFPGSSKASKSSTLWRLTSLFPLVSLGILLAAVITALATSPQQWPDANLHEMTFGISGILGLFGFLSLAAGPLALGALVLATLFGGVLGTSIGLIVDTVLGTKILIDQGVGWSAVAMLGMLIWLLLWVVGLAIAAGHPEPEKGATKPLPLGWFGVVGRFATGFWNSLLRTSRGDPKPPSEEGLVRKFALIVGRRVTLEARMLFVASAIYGVAAFIDVAILVWRHGRRVLAADGTVVAGFSGMLTTIGKGLNPEALDRFDPGLVNLAITIAVLGPGYFALRSLRKGWSDSEDGKGRRRQVGILWDLGSFWPRWFHPLAPPGYGPKAVSDLAKTLEGLPSDAVVGAHSQGSLIAAVAMQQSGHGRRFLTYGSQLGILYPRMFPDVGIPNLVSEVDDLTPGWINLWRCTDPVGGHYVQALGSRNWLVGTGAGHSRYEMTPEYRSARKALMSGDLNRPPKYNTKNCWYEPHIH